MIAARPVVWILVLSFAAASAPALADASKPRKRMVTRPLGQARKPADAQSAAVAGAVSSKRVIVSSPSGSVVAELAGGRGGDIPEATSRRVRDERSRGEVPAATLPANHKPAVKVIVNPVTGKVKEDRP